MDSCSLGIFFKIVVDSRVVPVFCTANLTVCSHKGLELPRDHSELTTSVIFSDGFRDFFSLREVSFVLDWNEC